MSTVHIKWPDVYRYEWMERLSNYFVILHLITCMSLFVQTKCNTMNALVGRLFGLSHLEQLWGLAPITD